MRKVINNISHDSSKGRGGAFFFILLKKNSGIYMAIPERITHISITGLR